MINIYSPFTEHKSTYYESNIKSQIIILSLYHGRSMVNNGITFLPKRESEYDHHHLSSNRRKHVQLDDDLTDNGTEFKLRKSSAIFIDNKSYNNNNEEDNNNNKNMVHCTSPVGSMDGSVLVESESGEFSDFTTLQVS